MKNLKKCVVALLAFVFVCACNHETQSSDVKSSTSVFESNDESSSNIQDSSSNVLSSISESSSIHESNSSIESSSIHESNSEVEVSYDEAYLIGYGSYLTGTDEWKNETGVQLELHNDNPDALEKYVVTLNLQVGDVFLIHLMSTPDRWYNFDDLNDVTHGDYTGKFFESIGDKNIKTLVSGNYTIYFTVWKNYTSSIWIDVNSFEVPQSIDDAYLIGYGSFLNGSGDWEETTGIKLEEKNDNPDALEKYVTTLNLAIDDTFLMKIKAPSGAVYANYTVIDDGCEVKTTHFATNSENHIKTLVAGNYTFYLTVWKDYSTSIWITLNQELTADNCSLIGYGSYYPDGSESWSDIVFLTSITPDDASALEKYTITLNLSEGDVILVHLLSENARWYGYDALSCDIKETHFEQQDTNNIKVKVTGNYTFYITIWANYSASIWCCIN